MAQEGDRVDPPLCSSCLPVCTSGCTYVLSRGSASSLFHFNELPCKSLIKDLELASSLLDEAIRAPRAYSIDKRGDGLTLTNLLCDNFRLTIKLQR